MANGTFLVLCTCYRASRFGIGKPIGCGMCLLRYHLLCGKHCVTYGTVATLGKTGCGAGCFHSRIGCRGVSQFSNNFLSYKRFITNRAMLSFAQSSRHTGRINSGINNLGVSKCINALRFLLATRASAFLFAFSGASRFFCSSPLTKGVCVNWGCSISCVARRLRFVAAIACCKHQRARKQGKANEQSKFHCLFHGRFSLNYIKSAPTEVSAPKNANSNCRQTKTTIWV